MSLSKLCPKCGATDAQFIGEFCKNCYLHDREIISIDNELDVDRCNRCGKIRRKGKMIEENNLNLEEFITSKVRVKEIADPEISVEVVPIDKKSSDARVSVKGIIGKTPLIVAKSVKIKFRDGICDACMKLSSRYYESTVQFRYGGKPDADAVKKTMDKVEEILSGLRKTDSLAGVVDTSQSPNGFDVLIGSKRAGRIVAEKLAQGSKVAISSTLAGVDKKGKTKYRVTYCVRIKS